MKVEIEVTRKTVLKTISVLMLLFIFGFGGFTAGVSLTWPVAYKKGYEASLEDIRQLLEQEGIELTWTELPNGAYRIELRSLASGKILWAGTVELHMRVEHWRDGKILSVTEHPMTLTNFGKNWIADKLSGASSDFFMNNATWIGMSNSTSAVDKAWTILPDEITTDGLARAQGTVTDTGTGTWNVTKTFSVTGIASTKLYGLYLNAYNGATLLAAEQQGEANQKNLASGDTLKITIQGSVS